MQDNSIRLFCVAPMMGYTTPYARKLYRILTKKAFLFTEMKTLWKDVSIIVPNSLTRISSANANRRLPSFSVHMDSLNILASM